MSGSIKSHARSERLFSSRCVLEKTFHSRERAFFLGDEFKENTPRTKRRSSVRKRVRAHARTFARSRSDARLHSPENNTCGEFPVFQKLQFRVLGRPERRSKVTSVYRKTSNASTSSGFHRERETEPFTRSIASLLYIIARVVSKQKHRLNTRKEQSI